jgi:hypothetical protein
VTVDRVTDPKERRSSDVLSYGALEKDVVQREVTQRPQDAVPDRASKSVQIVIVAVVLAQREEALVESIEIVGYVRASLVRHHRKLPNLHAPYRMSLSDLIEDNQGI